jgi:hypothetical protein
MANGDDAVSSTVKSKTSDKPQLPWRPFKDRPTGIWIDETVRRIKETAAPEDIESLYRNQIPKNAKFRTLKHLITIDGKKRSKGDNCPCPMCTPNRFLTGSLVWFPDLQFCAFIGNCCANDDVLAEAEKERKWRERRDAEESYLLSALPLVGPKLTVLDRLKPVALEAVRAYRKIRTGVPLVHDQLRKVKQQHGGQLTLTQIIRDEQDENDDYFGPAGLKGRGKDGIETRDFTFGLFTGHIAVIKDYNPVKELETMNRKLLAIAAHGSEAEALNFIVTMTEKERHAAVVILRDVDESIFKFRVRLKDLASFFTRENAENFNAFFTHQLNSIYYRVEFTTIRGQPSLRFRRGGSTYDLIRGSWADKLDFNWPTGPHPERFAI